jgi:hypothetical protein
MKLLSNSFVAIAAIMFSVFAQPATASGNHEPHAAPVLFKIPGEPANATSFTVQLNRQGTDKRVCLTIDNPGKKNLHVSLSGPEGGPIDEFFTGKKIARLSKTYNFSIAEAGLYSIEVGYGNEKVKKQIRLEYSERPVDKLTIE